MFYSPYFTETQKTSVKLASSNVESFTKRSPSSLKGSTLSLGPYKDIKEFVYSPLTVHYLNNKPFAVFSTLQREVEVSHWGNIGFEEVYELKHVGAKLIGGFSRYEYQAKRSLTSPSFRTLNAILPAQAHDIYYRDQIGNISTSDMVISNDEIELNIETRFPIFGGWQTQFYIGYSLPTEVLLFIDNETGKYNLKFDFFTIFNDIWIEDLEIKVILPEGCTDITVNVPYSLQQADSKR